METLTKEQKAENMKVYKDQIAKPTGKEILVRVVEGCTMWYGPTPRLHKLHQPLEQGGEPFMVPEHVFLNSDHFNPKKSVNGAIIRGVLARMDRVEPSVSDAHSEDIHVLQERVHQLEVERAALMGNAPPPLLAEPEKRGPGRPRKVEEI
jgi:hypothetical protein